MNHDCGMRTALRTARVRAEAQEPARLPKKSLTLVKKLAASGWVAPDDNFSNSASNSCCFLVRFCGVSTMTCTYMSPVWRERSTTLPIDAMLTRQRACCRDETFQSFVTLSL